jgi:hypothetical protein
MYLKLAAILFLNPANFTLYFLIAPIVYFMVLAIYILKESFASFHAMQQSNKKQHGHTRTLQKNSSINMPIGSVQS